MIRDDCPFSLGRGLENHCDACAKPLSGRRTRWCSNDCATLFYKNHLWSMARKVARRRDKYKCIECGSKEKLEVNHKVPFWGRKRVSISCLNHLENLELLCHLHHVMKTREQRRIYGVSK